jgi:Zn-dependent protease with chaperone function
MSKISARQQQLIQKIVRTSHVYALGCLSFMAVACILVCYFSGAIIEPLFDIVLIVAVSIGVRLKSSTISKLKGYPFEQGKTVGSLFHETIQEVASVLSVKAPLLYISPDKSRNAICSITGRFNWFLLLSEGLEKADALEQRSVIAHELGHRKCLHSLWMIIGTALVIMLGMSIATLCEAQGFAFLACALSSVTTVAVGALGLIAFGRQLEFQADAIATVLCGKEGMINNLLETRLPILAAVAHHFQPELSYEFLQQQLKTSPKLLQLVLKMESSMSGDRHARSKLAKLKLLWEKLTTLHPSLAKRVQNIERFEPLAST